MKSTILSEISVCTDCMLLHANGEFDPDRPTDEPEPLALITEGYSVTLGGEHTDMCELNEYGECDCDQLGFSGQPCQGCGSWLGGDRYLMTLWQDNA